MTRTDVEFESAGSDQAIVIGAGIGGLLATRAVSDHVKRVVLIERDQLEPGPAPRKGVPQGRHGHALLARGTRELEALFPGLIDDVVAAGGHTGDALANVIWHQGGGYHANARLGVRGTVSSRGLLEGVIRDRVLALDNVHLIDGASVDELEWSHDRRRVTGVCLHDRAGLAHSIPAQLVIDASGRGSRLPNWLRAAGHDSPAETAIPVEIRYATRTFTRNPGEFGGAKVIAAVTDHHRTRGAFAFAIENDQWLMTITGRRGQQPPLDLPGFQEYARSLGVDELARMPVEGRPLDDGAAYAFRQSIYRQFAALTALPDGIIPFADVICSFNPIYGQGMTVAAIEAGVLAATLGEGHVNLARRFLTAVTPSIDNAWNLATGNDLQYLADRQPLPRSRRAMFWYLNRLQVAARTETAVAAAFARVIHLLEPPESLFSASILPRVLLHGGDWSVQPLQASTRSPAPTTDPTDVAIV